jgi:hypothetical protein
MARRAWIVLISIVSIFCGRAESNIDDDHSFTVSKFIGELDWLPSSAYGALINQYYCSGFIHGELVGWIQLGAGVPADKFHYSNISAADFGVNVAPSGALRGFAYGANIGWINFSDAGNPRVDWATGKLHGEIYAANAGWIALEEDSQFVRLSSLPEAEDSDKDGLPDAWEIQHALELQRLSGNRDSDNDGQLDRDEYLAGTNPLAGNDFLGPVVLTADLDSSSKTLAWPSKTNFIYRVEERESLHPSDPWRLVYNSEIMGTGGVVSIQIDGEDAEPRFYRVSAFPPLTVLP